MEEKKLWYAILRDEEDNDWGTGSFNKEQAIEMAKAVNFKLVAVIDGGYNESGNEATDPICVEIITVDY